MPTVGIPNSSVLHRVSLAYEKAPQREKEVVERLLEPYINNAVEFSQPEVRALILPSMPVCAGMGNPLDDNMEFREITVLKNKYTYGATHIIDLSGDSMEPEFHDGDKLIVTAMPYGSQPTNGRVGIFLYNGDAYLRQPLDGRLHPYNSAYEDIVPNEYDDVRYVGYVVGILDDSWVVG
jgi:phage repressor protein C with HTH and peptisase S24 domain